MYTGASKPGTSRLYELTDGAKRADSSRAWRSWPAMNALASAERKYSSPESKNALLSPRKSDWWVCIPEPFSPNSGLGMKVAQCEDHVAAEVGGDVQGRQVEVPALVQDLGPLVVAEEKELELRTEVVVVEAHLLRTIEGAAHDVTGVALVGLAAGLEHVAEDAADRVLGAAPGEDPEGVGVGHGDHVGLLDAVEARDRGPVEAHAVGERVLQLVLADRERLELAEDVGEPEPDELDVLVLYALQDLGGVRSHAPTSFL